MQRLLTIVFVFITISVAPARVPYSFMFYNVENLFDTIDDPEIDDREFTPKSRRKWSAERYEHKVSNIVSVVDSIAHRSGAYPTVVALCEVENRRVLNDIITTPSMDSVGYGIVHYDSHDKRGIDVALLYRKDCVEISGSKSVINRASATTRDILTVWGKIGSEELFWVVLHAPSRLGGAASAQMRGESCAQIRDIVDSVRVLRPSTKFMIMGDFNDDPTDRSIVESLRAKSSVESLSEDDLFAPYAAMFYGGYGTSAYKGEWNLFDNIIVSANVVLPSAEGLKLQPSLNNPSYYGSIYRSKHLFQQVGHFRGYPLRTYGGKEYLGGYSDHLPIFVILE